MSSKPGGAIWRRKGTLGQGKPVVFASRKWLKNREYRTVPRTVPYGTKAKSGGKIDDSGSGKSPGRGIIWKQEGRNMTVAQECSKFFEASVLGVCRCEMEITIRLSSLIHSFAAATLNFRRATYSIISMQAMSWKNGTEEQNGTILIHLGLPCLPLLRPKNKINKKWT